MASIKDLDELESVARLFALQNAVQFNGKANPKAVTGKIIAATKDKGILPKDIIQLAEIVCTEINQIPLEKQQQELKQNAPDMLVKEKQERDFSLPKLPFAEKGKVITRFPPEPNGYLHIGHAKAAYIDSEYAKKYEGTFILRFDDTNPANAQLEFYDAQKEDLTWLGISWDKEYNTSDNLQTHYKLAEQLISKGHAYLCKCSSETIKKGRFHQKSCSCKQTIPGDAVDHWKELLNSGESAGAILRLHADMTSANTALRDPTLFRVIDLEHPKQGSKYRVWPTYDFAGAVEDSLSGVTHPFRTKEYELRDPVYYQLLSLLNLRKPHLMEFARLKIIGMPVSKRRIKPLIDEGHVMGYDDPRLPTLRGLQKRGILAESIKQFVFEQGLSKVESQVTFGLIEAINRKRLDPIAKRYFFVPNPIELVVFNAPKKTITIKSHPTKDLGTRSIQTGSQFMIPKDDLETIKPGDLFRLKDLFNVTVTERTKTSIIGEYSGENLIPNSLKLQWTTANNIPFTILKPDLLYTKESFNPNSLQEIQGVTEPDIAKVRIGEIIQFERFGFVRIDQQENKKIGIFCHK